MVERIESNIPASVAIETTQVTKADKKDATSKSGTVENKVLLSMLSKVPKDIHAQTIKQLSNSLPVPETSVRKTDINNALDKIDPNISMGIFFELLQKFMIWMRKSTRTEFLEERKLYQQEMKQAADDIRSAAGFAMASGIVGGALGIAASVVGIRGAIKAAGVDKSAMSEIGEMEQGFKLKNLQAMSEDAEPVSQNLKTPSAETTNVESIENIESMESQEQTLPKSVEAGYSVEEGKVNLNPQSQLKKLSDVKLTEEQKQQISDLRTVASNRGARIMQQADIAKSVIGSGAQIISGSLEFASGLQKAQQAQEEALASTSGSYAEQQTQLYAQAGESIGKLQQKLSSIIESDIEARRTIIRS